MTNATKKAFLITGVSSGIGAALAGAALAEGHIVAGTVRNAEQAEIFKRIAPGQAHAVLLDLAENVGIEGSVDRAIDALGGRVDVLVNNAGHGLVGAVEETSVAEAQRSFNVNFFGALSVTQSVLPTMRRQGSGRILFTSAIGGFTGFAGLGVYSAAKAATDILGEALALEVEPFGIQVTVLTLGIFRTAFASASLQHTATELPDYIQTPAGKFRSFIEGLSGKQPNDPQRAAQAILEIVHTDRAPMHLALGKDALSVMKKKIDRLQVDMEAWRVSSESVAYPI